MSNLFHNSYQPLVFATIYAVTIISIVLAVAFFTVLERKVLAAVQRRRGPNLVGFWGLLQALADGLKLLAKEPVFVSGANYYIFLFAPILLLTMSLTLWVFVPLPGFEFGVSNSYSFVVVFLFSALNSYAIVLAGIASNSRYSLIGGVRAIAQLISYELPLSVSLLTLFCVQGSFNLYEFAASKLLFAAILLPTIIIFFVSLLAETNRTPFDLPEAEAELVAGYNLEYSSILFSLFFLAEYSNILLAASLISLLFFPGYWFYFGVILVCLVIILLRAILPRYTFAQLINLCWTSLFPASLALLLFTITAMFVFNLYSIDHVRPELLNVIEAAVNTSSVGVNNCFAFVLFSRGSFCSTPDVIPAVRNAHLSQELYADPVPAANLLIFFAVAFFVVCALVGINWIAVNFRANNKKNSPYECGFEPVGSPVADFTPNFTAVALIFLIYDVEVLLTFPWAYSMVGKSAAALCVFVFYVWLMLLGLVYEILDESFNVV